MSTVKWVILAGVVAAVGTAGTVGAYKLASQRGAVPESILFMASTSATERKVAYYQHPGGKADYSPEPRNDEQGRPYLPVYDETLASAAVQPPAAQGASKPGRILYYRHPMGLPDVSPVPKKDSMGMDYVAVYEGDEPESVTVKVSLEKVQRLGVQTAAVQRRILTYTVRAVGTVQFDERGQAAVTARYEGWVEKLAVNTTGQAVRKGETLLTIYSPEVVQAQQDYLSALGAGEEMAASGKEGAAAAQRLAKGAMQRLVNLNVPESVIDRLQQKRAAVRAVPMLSPVTGVVLEKMVLAGQRVMPGESLYLLATTDPVWLIAEVFEQDLGLIRIGQKARVTLPAYPGRQFTGQVSFIYPVLTPETRTARIRIEIPNPVTDLKAEMYASVEIDSQTTPAPVLAVPDSAVLDSGVRRVVFVERGPGRFEPREVKLGVRGEGYAAVVGGLKEGERVVVRANFLIDAESNMRAALQTFTAPESPR